MKKSTKVLLYGIPSVLLLSCAGLYSFAYKTRTDRDRAVARLAQVGLPTDPDQIKHIPDPDKDAGELLKKFDRAFLKARKVPAYFSFYIPNLKSARAFVNANPQLVRLRKQLFTKSEFATQLEPSMGHQHEFYGFAALAIVVWLGLAEAQVLSADGAADRAIDLCTETTQFLHLLNSDPNHTAELLSVSLQQAVNRHVADIVESNSERAEVRRALQRYLHASVPKVDFRRAVIEDLSNALALEKDVTQGKVDLVAYDESINGGYASISEVGKHSLYRIKGAPDMLFARLYEGYADLYARIPKDPSQHKDRIEVVTRWDRVVSDQRSPNSYLLQSLMPQYSYSFKSEAKLTAEWRTLNALLAASEIKAKTGCYPTNLPVTGQNAIDPFTDQPLKYLPMDGKLAIYSVGDDLLDNQGKLFRLNYLAMPGSSAPPLDIGFSIPYDVPARLR